MERINDGASTSITADDADCSVKPMTSPIAKKYSMRVPFFSAEASYGLYLWPCARVLCQFLCYHRQSLPGIRVLELGCGVGLPGIVAAKFGAQVTFSDAVYNQDTLDVCRKNCEANGVVAPKIVGLSWGTVDSAVLKEIGPVDWILLSDCFYDPSVFNDLLLTITWILGENPNAVAYFAYQERSADWSIEDLLELWGLHCRMIPVEELEDYEVVVDNCETSSRHSVQLGEIRRHATENH